MGFCCKILSLNDLYPESDQSTGNPLFTMTMSQRACKPAMWWPDDDTSLFLAKPASRWLTKALCWKSGGRKKVLVMLGSFHPTDVNLAWYKSDFGRKSPLTEGRTSSANHLFTLHTAAHADHRVAIPILHVKYRAQFLLGVGWGGMSYWVYVTLSCHNYWKCNGFCFSGAYFIY